MSPSANPTTHTCATSAPLLPVLLPHLVLTNQYIVYESLVARALDMRRAAAAARAPKHLPGAAAAGGGGAPHVLLGAGDIFLLSAAAKVVATLVTYPMLVIKNRLQVRRGVGGVPMLGLGTRGGGWGREQKSHSWLQQLSPTGCVTATHGFSLVICHLPHPSQAINRHTEESMQYQGVWHAIRSMAAAEGLVGFYKGMRVKLLQTVLAAALLMVLKEKIFLATRAALAPAAAAAAARRTAGI